MSQLSFQNQELRVDWIGFNCKKLSESELEIVAEVLSEYGFNSIIMEKKGQEREIRQHITRPRNYLTVKIEQHFYRPEKKEFWDGTKISFTGENANSFYSSILARNKVKTSFWFRLSGIIDPKSVTLGRLDICFDRSNKGGENDQTFRKFIESSHSELVSKHKRSTAKMERNKQGFILKIGSRQSTKYFRVYQRNERTRFELEIKNKDQYLKSIQSLLFQDYILLFEEQLINYFFLHSKKVLDLTFSYTDWIVSFFQKQRYIQTSLNQSFLVSYLNDDYKFTSDFKQLQHLYTFLQFLSFSHTQPSESINFGPYAYQLIEFKVQHFMDFIGAPNSSAYKMNQLVEFFYSLAQTPPLIQIFSEREFQILATFPFILVDQDSGFWKAKIHLNYQLYNYQYPFKFPKSYLTYQNKYDMQVKLQIIKSFTNTTLQKKFKVLEFLQQFSTTPNQVKAGIKHLIVNALQALLEEGLIQNRITLHVIGNKRKNKSPLRRDLKIELNQLTPLLIGKTEVLYCYEII